MLGVARGSIGYPQMDCALLSDIPEFLNLETVKQEWFSVADLVDMRLAFSCLPLSLSEICAVGGH